MAKEEERIVKNSCLSSHLYILLVFLRFLDCTVVTLYAIARLKCFVAA